MSPRQRRAGCGPCHRSARARRPRRRAPWAALLPLLLAYACLLGLSPVGQAGLLRVHLATEHHEASVPPAAAHRHHDDAAHGHASADHGHGAHHEDVADGREHRGGRHRSVHEDAPRPASPAAPHEHHGRVHTHDPAPVEDPAVAAGALSEFYLAARAKSPPPPARDAAVAPAAAPAPRQAASPVETPPPRRPG